MAVAWGCGICERQHSVGGRMTTRQRRRKVGSRGGMARARGAVRRSALDQYLPHFDAVLRHGAVIPASPDDAYAWLERFDFAQVCAEVGRAVGDMRAVPRGVAAVARQAERLPPGARFLLDDAVQNGFVLLTEKPGRHIVLGAVGKLWNPRIELLQLSREEFAAFHEAKYVKAVIGFLVVPYGEDRTLLKIESRFLATDPAARAHFRRSWHADEPFLTFLMRRVVRALKGIAKEQRDAEATPPPWRRPGVSGA